MEADWEIEIGPGAPILDAHWSGLADLRRQPELAHELPEAAILPGLADALERLNTSATPFNMWTSKCDVWQVAEGQDIDPYEFEATAEETRFAWGCYIDLLPVSDQQWGQIWDPQTSTPSAAVARCKAVCNRLRSEPMRCCRVDLVIRRAAITETTMDTGITAYVTACGATSNEAKAMLSKALARFVDGIRPQAQVE
jgi:hypothetical protein